MLTRWSWFGCCNEKAIYVADTRDNNGWHVCEIEQAAAWATRSFGGARVQAHEYAARFLPQAHVGVAEMNLQEFAALKVGDKIANDMSDSAGEVVAIDAKGVHVQWDEVGPGVLAHDVTMWRGVTRHYTAQTTAWFHWTKQC